MPENSQLTPLDIQALAEGTEQISRLSLLTVKLLNEGDIEEAKHAAALCKEGMDLTAAFAATLSVEDRAAAKREIFRKNAAKFE